MNEAATRRINLLNRMRLFHHGEVEQDGFAKLGNVEGKHESTVRPKTTRFSRTGNMYA